MAIEDMNKKDVGNRAVDSKKRYALALLGSILVFFIAFATSYGINAFEFQRISSLQDDVFYDFYEAEVSYDLFGTAECSGDYFEDLGQSLDFQGAMLRSLEKDLGKDNEYVVKRKAYYSLLQLSHYNFMKKRNDACDLGQEFILFFYSNEKEYIDESEQIGKILSYVKANNPNTLIYSFETDSANALVSKFNLRYEVTSPILVVVKDVNRLESIESSDQIEKYLKA